MKKNNQIILLRYVFFTYLAVMLPAILFVPFLNMIQTESLILLGFSITMPLFFYFIEYQHKTDNDLSIMTWKYWKVLGVDVIVLSIVYLDTNDALSALNRSLPALSKDSSILMQGNIKKPFKGDFYDFSLEQKQPSTIKVKCNLLHGLKCPYHIKNGEKVKITLTPSLSENRDLNKIRLITSFQSNTTVYTSEQYLQEYKQQKKLAWFYSLLIFLPSLIIFYLLNKTLFSKFKETKFKLYTKKYNVS